MRYYPKKKKEYKRIICPIFHIYSSSVSDWCRTFNPFVLFLFPWVISHIFTNTSCDPIIISSSLTYRLIVSDIGQQFVIHIFVFVSVHPIFLHISYTPYSIFTFFSLVNSKYFMYFINDILCGVVPFELAHLLSLCHSYSWIIENYRPQKYWYSSSILAFISLHRYPAYIIIKLFSFRIIF